MGKMVSSAHFRQVFQLISKTAHTRTLTSSVEHPLFTAVAKGDVSTLNDVLQDSSGRDVNVRDDRGWTALMLAARQGHGQAVSCLLRSGADSSLVNKTGQSAFELAVFWRQRETAELLKRSQMNGKATAQPFQSEFTQILHRHSSLRSDSQWLSELMQKPSTVFIAMHSGSPVVVPLERKQLRLSRFTYDQVKSFISDQQTIFLGTEEEGLPEPTAYFCVDLSKLSESELVKTFPGVEVAHIFRLMMMKGLDKRLVSQARPLFDWHRNPFCSRCGHETKMDSAGYKRVCLNSDCSTHKRIYNISYPRVDPTVICTVISSDGKRCLLAHKPTHPTGMYSCIAGFVEPGESLEEACAREVEEEVGLTVVQARYHSSQSWPMPSCIMIGYMTRVTEKEEIQLDREELEDGRWFEREEVVQLLTHEHPKKLYVPPIDAIAHSLIKTWVMESAFV